MATPSTGDDLLWRASIDDQTESFFTKFDANVDKVNKTAKEGFDGIDKSVKKAGISMGLIGGIIGGLTSKLADMAMNGIQSFAQFMQASMDVRARVDTLGVSLNVVGQNAGYTVEQLDEFEKSIKKKNITTQQARDSLIQMAQAELDLSKAADLARVAQDAAVNAGITSAEALDRITRAIVTQQPEILRNLNLTISSEAAYAKYGATIGKTANELTMSERKQAFMNAVMEKGDLIAGTYEASMNSVGKLLGSVQGRLEELQYELGGMFQPAYLALVREYKQLIEDVTKFIINNKESFTQLGVIGAQVLTALVDKVQELVSLLTGAVTGVVNLANAIATGLAPAFGLTSDQVDVFKNNIFETFSKAYALAKATAEGIGAVFSVLFTQIGENWKAVWDGISKGTFGETKDIFDPSLWVEMGQAFEQTYNESLKESVTVMEDAKKATDDLALSTNTYAESLANKLNDAIMMTNVRLTELQKRMDEEAAARALQAQRQSIEDELRSQWANEDRERQHAERIADILENAEEARANLTQQAADNRVQIEEDYRKRLQQIQQDFEFEAGELARKRDATGLLALIRQNKRTLEKEKDAYEERKREAEENYRKTIESLDKSLQDQLKRAEEARAKELEDIARNLERERILKELHNQWAEEDRMRAQRKALEDIIKFYMGLDGATVEGLSRLLQDWGWYFSELDNMIAQYNASASTMSDSSFDNAEEMRRQEIRLGTDINGDGVIGQAGQVSQMLSRAFTPAQAGVSRVPAVPGTSMNRSGGSRELRVTVDGNGLDPYFQRVLVNALIEVERNAGRG